MVSSGYLGQKGELWFVRLLPPPFPGGVEHIAFTTPYVLIHPPKHDWLAYLSRTLPGHTLRSDYEHHMKYGPSHDYWTEFVFEAYVNHVSGAVFLKGVPDIPESLPLSKVNQAR